MWRTAWRLWRSRLTSGHSDQRGASLKALADQVRRLPEGSVRAGEVVVALLEAAHL